MEGYHTQTVNRSKKPKAASGTRPRRWQKTLEQSMRHVPKDEEQGRGCHQDNVKRRCRADVDKPLSQDRTLRLRIAPSQSTRIRAILLRTAAAGIFNNTRNDRAARDRAIEMALHFKDEQTGHLSPRQVTHCRYPAVKMAKSQIHWLDVCPPSPSPYGNPIVALPGTQRNKSGQMRSDIAGCDTPSSRRRR